MTSKKLVGRNSHPALQSYAATVTKSFPLILVFGREPNTDFEISGVHDLYDFDAAPNCAFWNISYATIAATVKLSARELKDRCRSAGASPLVYADALPIGILNSVANKRARRAVDPTRVDEHMARVFGFTPLISRVDLVVMSGIAAKEFEHSRMEIERHCGGLRIPFTHSPFFHGNNGPRIRAALTPLVESKFRIIAEDFLSDQS